MFGCRMVAVMVACIGAAGAAGPFFDPALPLHASAADTGGHGVIARGLLVRAGEREWVVFDQDLLRPALWFRSPAGKPPLSLALMAQASWDEPTRKAGVRCPIPAEKGRGLAPALPGVGAESAAVLEDPRPVFGGDPGRGGLEESGRRFLGYHLAGETAVLSYECAGVRVREWYEADRGRLSRHLAADAGGELVFLVAAGDFTVNAGREAVSAELRVVSNHAGLKLEAAEGYLVARLAGSRGERRVSFGYGEGGSPPRTPEVPSAFAARWKQPVETRLREAEKSGPGWALDRLPLPEGNPWKRRVRPADIVFLSPERAAVVTFEGDVWRVDLAGQRARWTRFAGGLCEPLAIGQVKGVIQVFTRNGIVRLHDLNGDGEADFYENHSSLIRQTVGTRGYPLDMEVDEEGRTWCSVGGIVTDDRGLTNRASENPHVGAIVEIAPDGREIRMVSSHAREPFFGRDPVTGRMAMTEQQGHWVPSSGSFPVTEGANFGYGVQNDAVVARPAVWIPHDQDTSSASPLWLRDTAFKAWEGGLLQLSYGTGRLFLVRHGEGWPAKEGAVIPLEIETGMPVLHGRAHPADGSIWLAGFRIYDSRAPELEALARLRATGEPLAAPVDARVVKEGLIVSFGSELDPASVSPEAVQAKEWQYRRSPGYGSPRFRRDGQQGVDAVATGGVFLSKDRKSAFVHIPDLKPTMQLELSHRFRLKGQRGKEEFRPVFFTVVAPSAAEWAALGFDPPRLDASLAGLRETPMEDAQPTAERGGELAVRYGCIACHSTDGKQEGHSGPTWKGLHGSLRRFTDGTSRRADDAYLLEAMLEPDKTIVEGYAVGMASYAGVLSDAELQSVILYIRTLK